MNRFIIKDTITDRIRQQGSKCMTFATVEEARDYIARLDEHFGCPMVVSYVIEPLRDEVTE